MIRRRGNGVSSREWPFASPIHPEKDAPFFVGRQEDLRRLVHWGERSRAQMFIQSAVGIGRTSLVRMYSHQAERFYDQRLYFSGSTFDTPRAVMPAVRARLSQHGEGASASRNRPNLVILDDAHQLAPESEVIDLLHAVGDRPIPQERWIVTANSDLMMGSRLKGSLIRRFDQLTLRPFNMAETEEFIRKCLNTAGMDPLSVDNATIEVMQEADRFGGNPALLSAFLFQFLRSSSIDRAFSQLDSRFAQGFTNLLLVPTGSGLSVLPANQMATYGLVTPSSTILPATPYVVISPLRVLWKEQLEEFEQLLNEPSTSESEYQHYFERHPHFLAGIEYENVLPHPILEREEDGALIPDFLLQPAGNQYADILDLKLPTEKLVVGRKDRLRFSSAVHEAIAQVREYRDYFEDQGRRERFASKYGFTSYRPSVAVIVGRTPAAQSEMKMRQIIDQLPPEVTITTYDVLLNRMRRMADRFGT
jgi:hypothetical protein